MSKTRFDLEQSIMECWAVVDDLKLLSESIEELKLPAEKQDKMMNILLGLAAVNDMKFDRLFKTFTEVMELDQ